MKNVHGYIHSALKDFRTEIGAVEGRIIYANRDIDYVEIVDVPDNTMALKVHKTTGEVFLLEEPHRNLSNAVWAALIVVSHHATGRPADVRYLNNRCTLEHLHYDSMAEQVYWKEETAELDRITAELTSKLMVGVRFQ